MAEEKVHIDYLIARYLSGEAVAEERTKVEVWCKASVENQRYFDELRQIFEHADTLENDTSFDVDAAWAKVAPQIRSSKKRVNMRSIYWAAAASVALFLGIWWGFLRSSSEVVNSDVVVAALTEKRSTFLPDSTKVVVEPNSSITYADGYGKVNRDVTLRGNASFEVQHRRGPAFTVRAGETLIRDIGTAFRVNTTGDTSVVEVYVKKGSVMFYTVNNKGVLLKEGDTGIYNKITKEFVRVAAEKVKEENPLSGKSFEFNETSLGEVAELLSKAFNTKVVLANPRLRNCTITVSFNNENIDTILDIVTETLNITVERNSKGDYIIRGDECATHH